MKQIREMRMIMMVVRKPKLQCLLILLIYLGFNNYCFSQFCHKKYIKLINQTEQSIELPVLFEERISSYNQEGDTLFIELSNLNDTIKSSHGKVTFVDEPITLASVDVLPNQEFKYSLIDMMIDFSEINYIFIEREASINFLKKIRNRYFELMY